MDRKDIENAEFVRVVGAGLGCVGYVVSIGEHNVTLKTANTTGPDDFMTVNYSVIEKLEEEDINLFLKIVADCQDIYGEFIYDLNKEPRLAKYHIKLNEALQDIQDQRMRDFLLNETDYY